MSNMPAVVVRKGGFLTALFHGLFGLLTVIVVCGTGLGIYGLHVVDGKTGDLLTLANGVVTDFPEWLQNLPPLLAETLDDRRAPDYMAQVDVSVETVAVPGDRNRELTIVEVENKGSQTITVLALTVVLEDEDGIPLRECRTYAATPIAVNDDEWRGPLLPERTRRFVVCRHGHDRDLHPRIDVAELRVWNGPQAPGVDAVDALTSAAPG
jgi:hypothetical protein